MNIFGISNGERSRICNLKGYCPNQLDDGDKLKQINKNTNKILAGRTGLEPASYGFGDR